MKKIYLVFILLTAATIIYAQEPINKGQAQLNAGVGSSSWGLPIYLGLDYGVNKDITVGCEISFRSYHDTWSGNNYDHTIFGVLGNANYHFNSVLKIPTNWDFYAGLNIGFNSWNSPDNYGGAHSSGLGLGGQIGGRYYFNNKIGVNLELGGGNAFSDGKFGISIKI